MSLGDGAKKAIHERGESLEALAATEQIRLLPDPCAICGRSTGLMIEQGGVFACVECHTKENGEDGDPGK